MADTAAAFAGIHNGNEFFSHRYRSELFTGDIRDAVARWRDGTGGRRERWSPAFLASSSTRFWTCGPVGRA